MPITHTNRAGQTYYLHTGPKRGGGLHYYFSLQAEGSLADAAPAGFEIYESVHGQVLLRRKEPKLIHDKEKASVETAIQKLRSTNLYRIEIRRNVLTIFESASSFARLMNFAPVHSPARNLISNTALQERFASYQAVLRFILADSESRLFAPERFCFRGSVDGWIPLGPPEPLAKLALKYVKHLGKDSFYELS